MLDNHKIGNRIALLLKEKGLTGEKFAEHLGVSPQALSKWENGKCLLKTALLCTPEQEDLAMLIALHIEPERQKAQLLLDFYYECLCEEIKDYSYETFMNDYKISIMEICFLQSA